MQHGTHESFERDDAEAAGSDRSFGLVFAGALAIVTLLNGWHGGRIWPWSCAFAILFSGAAFLFPALLHRPKLLWLKFGLLLHKIVNPVIMGLVFFGAVLPTGLVMRALGKDLLRLAKQPEATSYWIRRVPAGSPPETMKDQF